MGPAAGARRAVVEPRGRGRGPPTASVRGLEAERRDPHHSGGAGGRHSREVRRLPTTAERSRSAYRSIETESLSATSQ